MDLAYTEILADEYQQRYDLFPWKTWIIDQTRSHFSLSVHEPFSRKNIQKSKHRAVDFHQNRVEMIKISWQETKPYYLDNNNWIYILIIDLIKLG